MHDGINPAQQFIFIEENIKLEEPNLFLNGLFQKTMSVL
jgi:hypothetical protein